MQDVIIFLTDGAANTGPHYYGTNDPQRTRPCWSGTQAAAPLKSTTWIYSIGYALGSDICAEDRATNTPESPAMTPAQALVQIASNAGNYYNKPDTGQLNTIFTAIAADISTGKSKLID